MANDGSLIRLVTGESENKARNDSKKIVVGGIVGAIAGGLGTLVFSAFLALAIYLGAFDPAQFGEMALLAGLSDPLTGSGDPVLGYLIFLGGGMTTWPFLFAALNQYLPGWRMAVSGISFAAIGWTGFAIAFYSPTVNLPLFLVLTFVGQCLYGVVLGLVFEYAEPRIGIALVGTTFQ